MELYLNSLTYKVPLNDRTHNVFNIKGVSPFKWQLVCGTLYLSLISIYKIRIHCQAIIDFCIENIGYLALNENDSHVDNKTVSDIIKHYTTYKEVLWC